MTPGERLLLDGRTAYNVVVLLRYIAENLAPPDREYAAMLKQLSNTLLSPPTGGCERCGGNLPPRARTGRPRRYCVPCSPRKTQGKENA